ncbi:hypothetical protein CC80DRAFT_589895 [Byssothecium circinans]|uniref:DUF7924 domain-containing protein n=1 Tax=Byssothecium circinans TaxID=147558 RepID=A0A6A5UA08_9PLEO|nr:hypothetical protein CC80DRAFT_589895 [Byssothecium circinans]
MDTDLVPSKAQHRRRRLPRPCKENPSRNKETAIEKDCQTTQQRSRSAEKEDRPVRHIQTRKRAQDLQTNLSTEPQTNRTRTEYPASKPPRSLQQLPKKQKRRRGAEVPLAAGRQEEQSRGRKPKRRRLLSHVQDEIEPEKGNTSESSRVSNWVDQLPESFPADTMHQHRLSEKKSSASLRRKRRGSNSSVTSPTPSDQKSRDGKLPNGFADCGGALESELDVSDYDDVFCQNLLQTECRIPPDTLLGDDVYRDAISDLQERNESRVIQDIGRLLVPSVQTLAKVGEKRYLVFVESVNEAWDCCYPLIDPRPQPDYAVGIGRSGLTEARIRKLHPLIQDDPLFRSEYKATYYMYFLFFTTEVKCGTQGLVIADRQNAHSMGITVSGIVHIHRLAGKESQLHNKPVAYSVSHEHRMVRLTGWGPVIDGDFFTVQPLSIHSFDITARKGLEKWTTRKYTIGVYEYGLKLLEKINTIIDELPPDLNLEKVRPLKLGLNIDPETRPSRSGLSQQVDAYSLSENTEVPGSRASDVESRVSTPATSASLEKSLKRVKPSQ